MSETENVDPNMEVDDEPIIIEAWASNGQPVQYDEYEWVMPFRNRAQQNKKPLSEKHNRALEGMHARYQKSTRLDQCEFKSPVTKKLTRQCMLQINQAVEEQKNRPTGKPHGPKKRKQSSRGTGSVTRGSHAATVLAEKARVKKQKTIAQLNVPKQPWQVVLKLLVDKNMFCRKVPNAELIPAGKEVGYGRSQMRHFINVFKSGKRPP